MANIYGSKKNDDGTYQDGIFYDKLTGIDSADYIYGDDGNDILIGKGGNDTLDGGTGADEMSGGTGDDIYYVDSYYDVVIESANEGIDLVRSSTSYALGANIENLALTGSAWKGVGNSLNNQIWGNQYNNYIDGGEGADIMMGLGGNDTYVVDNTGDSIYEYVDNGIDTVKSSINYTLGANLENLELTGNAYWGRGNELNNKITGNENLSNALYGLDGSDTLIGGNISDTLSGGTGIDEMSGSAGNDTYYVDNTADVVIEGSDFISGYDRVYSTAQSYTLADNVEELTLSSYTYENFTIYAYEGIGNDLNNSIYGNSISNRIDGGLGNDAMFGGGGNDTYIVNSSWDKVTEYADQGTDSVFSSTSYTLSDHVENLYLTGYAYRGTGNELNNRIEGNDYANRIDGGIGADTMYGYAGDDTYTVDNGSDLVTEYAGGGIDTVESSISYTLGANVEKLTLTGSAYYAGGNELNNTLIGNDSINFLSGAAGSDTIYGYGGNDYINGFRTTGSGSAEYDVIYGGAGADTFVLGGSWGVSYRGDGYAGIKDWNALEDKVTLKGDVSQYSLGFKNYGGTSALDTEIRFGSDVIAILEDTTSFNFAQNATFIA